jgi:Flp pilus assembly protein TadG
MRFADALSSLTRRFVRDSRAISAVEFALILPMMMVLWLGGVEVAQAISASRKLTIVSRTVADLASQPSTLSTADITNILNSASLILAPFNPSTLKVTVTCLTVDNAQVAKVTWSSTRGGTVHTTGQVITLSAPLNAANTSVVWTEAQYDHTPTIGYVLTGTLQLRDKMYMRPRLGTVCPART